MGEKWVALLWGRAQPRRGRRGREKGGSGVAHSAFSLLVGPLLLWLIGVSSLSYLGAASLRSPVLWGPCALTTHGGVAGQPDPCDGAGTRPVPFTLPSPTQHPHLKSPSWYFPNACRMMVTMAMRGFTMQNCSVACTGGRDTVHPGAAGTSHCPPCSSCHPQPLHASQPRCSRDRHGGESSSPSQERPTLWGGT